MIVDGETEPIETDLVIYATGYLGDKKLVNLFKSHYFQKIVASTPTTTTPLYRYFLYLMSNYLNFIKDFYSLRALSKSYFIFESI